MEVTPFAACSFFEQVLLEFEKRVQSCPGVPFSASSPMEHDWSLGEFLQSFHKMIESPRKYNCKSYVLIVNKCLICSDIRV